MKFFLSVNRVTQEKKSFDCRKYIFLRNYRLTFVIAKSSRMKVSKSTWTIFSFLQYEILSSEIVFSSFFINI